MKDLSTRNGRSSAARLRVLEGPPDVAPHAAAVAAEAMGSGKASADGEACRQLSDRESGSRRAGLKADSG